MKRPLSKLQFFSFHVCVYLILMSSSFFLLSFTVSRTVQVTAIGLYGPDKAMLGKGEALQNYSVDIQLFSYPIAEGKNQRTLISRASRQVATKDDYDVHFFAPVTVAKDKLFHIRLAFKVRSVPNSKCYKISF